MRAKQIVVLGGGFAGLWSTVGAARKLDELAHGSDAAEVTLVNRDGYHCIRVRNYEADLSAVRVPRDGALGPIGVRFLEGEIAGVDLTEQTVTVATAIGQRTLLYDRLVFALGSQLLRPNVPGLAEHGFDVDTYSGAARLYTHLESLPSLLNLWGSLRSSSWGQA
jgi:NADH:ubiquinone reductase (H+-translocating)